MSAIVELAAARRDGSGIAGVARTAAVDLQPGSVVALPWREFWLPWVVVEEAVPLRPAAVLILMRRIRPAAGLDSVAAAVPVGVRFGRGELVDVLPRHFGVCARCGGLAPCVDEWVERHLPAASPAAGQAVPNGSGR